MKFEKFVLSTLACFLFASCNLDANLEDKSRSAAKPGQSKKSADEIIQEESFSKYQEIFLEIEEESKVKFIEEELRVTADMKKWLIHNSVHKAGGKSLIFLGYLQTQMRGFYIDRKFSYYVYDQTFHLPIGFFFDDGKTYRYIETIDGKLEEEYLGTFSVKGSVQKILKLRGTILLQPMREFKKYQKS
jgi:hypothetical protein